MNEVNKLRIKNARIIKS